MPNDAWSGDTSTTASLPVDSSRSGSIDFDGDSDWLRVSLTAYTSYTFTVGQSGLHDPWLRLYNSSGNQLDSTLDGQLNYTPSTGGTYYIGVEDWSSLDLSPLNYTVSLRAAPPPATLAIAAASAERAEGSSGSTSFTFTVTRSGNTSGSSSVQYAVAGSGSNAAGATDFAGGSLPAGSVSFAAGETSKTITISVAGDTTYELDETFTVSLSSPSGATLGTASATGTISNDDPLDDYAASTTTTGRLTAGSSGTGVLESNGDRDWFAIELVAGVNYTFDLAGAPTSQGTLSDPYLYLYDGGGALVSQNDDGGEGVNSHLFYTPTASGTFYLGAGGFDDTETGSYTLTATRESNGGISLINETTTLDSSGTDTYYGGDIGTLLNGASPQVATLTVGTASTAYVHVPVGSTFAFDYDTFVVSLTAGLSYRIALQPQGASTLEDSNQIIWVYPSSGSPDLVMNEIRSLATGSYDSDPFTAAAGGDYYITVGLRYWGPEAGSSPVPYRLTVQELGGSQDAPVLAIAAADAVKDEGNSGATPFTFTVTRTGDLSGSTTVAYAVTGTGSTAADAGDFEGNALPSGTVSFVAGETSKTITVNVAGDTRVETDETFKITLSNPSGSATIATAEATGTIRNDEAGTPAVAARRYDFDGNGTTDVLWRNRSTGDLALTLGGTFQRIQGANGLNNNPGAEWRAVASGDFDADGKADLVFRNPDGSVAIWLMDGTTVKGGLLHRIASTSTVWMVMGAGDFDGDGDDDLLLEQRTNALLGVWNTDGTQFQNGANLSHPGLGWTIAGIDDFEGSGRDQILWRNVNDGRIARSAPGLSLQDFNLDNANAGQILDLNTRILGTADIDGDGKADILWRQDDGTLFGTYMDGGRATGFSIGTGLSQDTWFVQAVGDFTVPDAKTIGTGDGLADILWQNDRVRTAGNFAAVPFNRGNGPGLANPGNAWVIANAIELAKPARAVAQTDFDGDGAADVLFRNPNTGAIASWQIDGFGLGSGTGLLASAPNTSWAIAASGDFDGDGKADIAYRHTDGRVAVWLMNGRTLVRATVVGTVDAGLDAVAAGDFDGDGTTDLLWRDRVHGTMTIWQMAGGGISVQRVLGRFTPNWEIAGAADLDDDGRADLLFRNRISGDLARWRMEGFIRLDANLVVTSAGAGANPGPAWSVAGLGDFSGDGRADILYRHTDGRVAIWEMRDNRLVRGRTVGSLGAGERIVAVGDYDGDRQDDVLIHNTADGQITAWDSGDSTLASRSIVANAAFGSWRVTPQPGQMEHYGTLA